MNLSQYGWNPHFQQLFNQYAQTLLPARIIADYGNMYRVITEHGELLAEQSGNLRKTQQIHPAVGDFIAYENWPGEEKAIIHHVLPRFSKFSRKSAGREHLEQVVAANFNTVFIFNSLNQDFNIRKLERYLVLAWDSGGTPVIILSKADLSTEVEKKVKEVKLIAPGVDVYAVSSLSKETLAPLEKYFQPGKTIAFLGSSGVGKSTLINTLAGEDMMKVQEIRAGDDKGKHTTTHKEILLLSNGALVVDTPGMREVGLIEKSEGIHDIFADIEEFAVACRFKDCTHLHEPGCRVQQAIEEGELDAKRLDSYKKLLKESAYAESKTNERIRNEQKKRSKDLAMFTKNRKKDMW